MHKPIYLDYAAATPMHPSVLEAMLPYFSDKYYNPSATYLAARDVKNDIQKARATVAHHVGARPSEIIFTAGGSEANNLAIHGVMKQYPKGNIVISSIEHDSIMTPAKKYDYRIVNVLSDGRINLDDLHEKIDENTVLVSIMYANNEIGTIQPIKEIAKIIASKRSNRKIDDVPLLFHSDACQATNYLDIHASQLSVDLMTLNGGKIYGPKQSGVLYSSAGVNLTPLIDGGGQEQGLRSGTENVPAIMGFAKAVDLVQSERLTELDRVSKLRDTFISNLQDTIPSAKINGSMKYRLANNIHFTVEGVDNERLIMELDEQGIQTAAGSACSASNDTPSHVLHALGLSDEAAQSSLRITIGRYTTHEDMEYLLNVLSKLL